MKYRIFDRILESDIPLPELQQSEDKEANLFFISIPTPYFQDSDIIWTHHWKLPGGQISISSGNRNEEYWLHFPHLAHFRINPTSKRIYCYQPPETPENSIRHLLLDQVIPRLLSHMGEQILHASCVNVNHSAILFSGESGWGKSTLASFFHTSGHPLLTDDGFMLKKVGTKIKGNPSYGGARLFPDSMSLLPGIPEDTVSSPVSHYCAKKRLNITDSNGMNSIPVKAIFTLSNPEFSQQSENIIIRKLYGAAAVMALVKNCFPLDITDTERMGKQLQKLTLIASTDELSIYSLSYPRQPDKLPEIVKSIVKTLNTDSSEGD